VKNQNQAIKKYTNVIQIHVKFKAFTATEFNKYIFRLVAASVGSKASKPTFQGPRKIGLLTTQRPDEVSSMRIHFIEFKYNPLE
jgi:hypothetical protein